MTGYAPFPKEAKGSYGSDPGTPSHPFLDVAKNVSSVPESSIHCHPAEMVLSFPGRGSLCALSLRYSLLTLQRRWTTDRIHRIKKDPRLPLAPPER